MAVWLILVSAAPAQRGAEEPPVAGRPEDFSSLVGVFRISTSASPTEVQVEDPLILTVRITGQPDRTFKSSQPLRANLRLFSKQMTEDFFIEPLPEKDRILEKERTWEFVYRLRPKRLSVKTVPGLKLVYYMPARRRYQSSYADEIDLTVKPRPEAPPTKEAIAAARLPAQFYELVSGPEVLRRPIERPWLTPLLIGCFILPPLLCALTYRRWRRLHPDARQQMQQRRSQAAQSALRGLHLEPGPSEEQAFALLAGYLRQRFDFASTEPTPREVTQHLNRVGVSKNLRNRVADFIGTCDAARFAPRSRTVNRQMAEEAGQLIHALEAETQPQAVGLIPIVRSSYGRDRPRRSPMLTLVALEIVLLGGTSLAQERALVGLSLPDAELLRQAETEFQNGKESAEKPAKARKHFAASARHYDELRKRGVLNPDLYRNLGNAEILAGNLGGAIFAYRSGIRLYPNDAALRANLEYARGRARYPSPSRPAELPWRPSALVLLLLTLALYSVGCVAWTRRLIKGRGTWRAMVLMGSAFLAGAAFAWLEWSDWQQERYPLVVIAGDGVPLYRGNGESYPTHATMPSLNAGVETRRLYERGNWLQITLPGGEIGWVKKDAVYVE